MKRILYVLLSCLLLTVLTATAQNKPGRSGDTTLNLKVYGACIQCKDRIEEAVRIKGVQSGIWDEKDIRL